MTNSNYGNTNGLRCMSVQCRRENIVELNNTLLYNMSKQNVKKPSLKQRRIQSARDKMNAIKAGNRRRIRNINRPLNQRMNPNPRRPRIKQSVAPLSVGGIGNHREANISMPGSNRMRVRHEEFITDIQSNPNGAFGIFQASINPGLAQVFPWLAQIAARFEKYYFNSLRFEYRAKSSTTEPGTAISMIDYDSSDIDPTTKNQMLGSNSVDSSIWLSHTYSANRYNLRDVMPSRYIRTTAIASNSDIKLYDVGKYYLATQGNTTGNQAGGELFVVYDVELITPQLNLVNTTGVGASVVGVGPFSAATVFGANPQVNGISPGINILTGTFQTLRINAAGSFLMNITATGTSLLSTSMNYTLGTGVQQLATLQLANSAGTVLAVIIVIETSADASKNTFTFNALGTATLTSSSVRIAPYDANLG